MGLFRRGEKVDVVMFDKAANEIVVGSVTRDGNMLVDGLLGRQFPIVTKPVFLRVKNKKKLAYIVDVEKGATAEIVKDDEMLKLKTNPDLIGKVIDSRLIQQAFSIKPETRQILVAFVIGLGIGWFIGLLF